MKQESSEGFLKKAFKFIPEVRQEVSRVTWPSRKETMITTTFVFVFALVAAIYFMVVDQVVFRLVRWIIGLGA